MAGVTEKASPEVKASFTPSFTSGSQIGSTWEILNPLGHGGYGELYTVRYLLSPSSPTFAIKLEQKTKNTVGLHREIVSLQKLQVCPRVAKFVAQGVHENYRFLVMQLLGPDLHKSRNAQPNHCFGFRMAATLGIQMLDAIQDIHEAGYIHCDIKPSNFVVENKWESDPYIFIIDFGHAVQHLLPTGEPKPKTPLAPFRGTVRYASPHVLLRKDPGRRDDLWSFLFSLIELAVGKLPWPKNKDKDKTRRHILSIMKTDPASMVRGLPSQFELILRHLVALRYEHVPDYDYIRCLLQELADYEEESDGGDTI